MSRLALVAIAAGLCACAPMAWYKSGGTQDEFSRVRYECLQQSQQRVAAAQVNVYGGSASNQVVTNDTLYASCMNAHGWYLRQQPQATSSGGSSQQVSSSGSAPRQANSSGGSTLAPSIPINREKLREASQTADRQWRSVCDSSDYAPYFRHTACIATDITLVQMSDAAKISEAEKTVLSKVDELGNQYFNELLRAYRQYGGPTGQKVAAMREGLHSRGERNIFQLYGGEITWGEYNKARKELYEEARAETARIATP